MLSSEYAGIKACGVAKNNIEGKVYVCVCGIDWAGGTEKDKNIMTKNRGQTVGETKRNLNRMIRRERNSNKKANYQRNP